MREGRHRGDVERGERLRGASRGPHGIRPQSPWRLHRLSRSLSRSREVPQPTGAAQGQRVRVLCVAPGRRSWRVTWWTSSPATPRRARSASVCGACCRSCSARQVRTRSHPWAVHPLRSATPRGPRPEQPARLERRDGPGRLAGGGACAALEFGASSLPVLLGHVRAPLGDAVFLLYVRAGVQGSCVSRAARRWSSWPRACCRACARRWTRPPRCAADPVPGGSHEKQSACQPWLGKGVGHEGWAGRRGSRWCGVATVGT